MKKMSKEQSKIKMTKTKNDADCTYSAKIQHLDLLHLRRKNFFFFYIATLEVAVQLFFACPNKKLQKCEKFI
jgi:hypothetical protein